MKRVFEGVKKIYKIKSKNIKFKNQEFKLDNSNLNASEIKK
jgi:hypothetical protein